MDQLTKAAVRSLLPHYSSVVVVPGFLNFTHVRNTGAAFGILNFTDFPFKTVVIAVIAAAALIGVGLYAASLAHHQRVFGRPPDIFAGDRGVATAENELTARQMAVAYRHFLEPPHRLDWDVVVERQRAICYDAGRQVVR